MGLILRSFLACTWSSEGVKDERVIESKRKVKVEEKFARNSTMENKGKVEMGAQVDDVLENKLNNIID